MSTETCTCGCNTPADTKPEDEPCTCGCSGADKR
jgi:hypothetical protein